MDKLSRILASMALVIAVCIGTLIVLRLFGLLRPFSIPTGAMAPAVSPGDHDMMEGLSFLRRRPRRGDVIVFKTEGIASLPQDQFYVKRIAAEPGERLRLANGKLYINGHQVSLSNAIGEITYELPPIWQSSVQTNIIVPSACYFVLGDNSTNSLDSRFYGCVPRANVMGRLFFCYWPPGRLGSVK